MPSRPRLVPMAALVAIACAIAPVTAISKEANRIPLAASKRAIPLPDAEPLAATADVRGIDLLLRRAPDKAEALTALLAQQHNPRSVNYRKWITPAEYGEKFGPSPDDLAKVTRWASQHGLSVEHMSASRRRITLAGTASAVQSAFNAPLQSVRFGAKSIREFSETPTVPTDLGALVEGVMLSPPIAKSQTSGQFGRTTAREAFERRNTAPAVAPQLTMPVGGSIYTFVTPHDLAHIYNADTLWTQGITGAGQTIAVVARNDVRDDDWQSFRALWAMPQDILHRVHPGNCQAPTLAGKTFDDIVEPTADVEWAAAAAPGATIELASCADVLDTSGNVAYDGLVTSIRNLVDSRTPPDIITFSYATCEADLLGTAYQDINEVWTQAAAEGIAVVVASGDFGAGMCVETSQWATRGKNVNGFASSPHVVAVGGTEFSAYYNNVVSQYWDVTVGGTPENGYASALSYIPEMTWNEGCMSPQFYERYATTFATREKFCNSGFTLPYAYAGGGGPSATNSRPSWQTGVLGMPSDPGRLMPDVSLFSGTASIWHEALVLCITDPSEINPGCENNLTWSGGTSIAAPAYAGIQALINQRIGGRQGTPAYSLYQVGRLQYNGSGTGYGSAASCNSNLGTSGFSGCVFHDVTLGETTIPCYLGSPDCYAGDGYNQTGRLSRDGSGSPAYSATPGWDYATGLGSVNVANLVSAIAAVDAYASVAHVAGDVNGDGFADVTVNDPTRGVIGVVSLQAGKLTHSRYDTLPAGATVSALGDINADGSSDLLLSDSTGFITAWISEGQGPFNKLPLGPTPTGARLVGANDFDGNGFDDLVFDNPGAGTATIWLMTGLSSQSIVRSTGIGTRVVGIADIEGDGLADLVVMGPSGQISALLSLPDNSVRVKVLGTVPSGSMPVGAADLDANGTADVFFYNATSGMVSVWIVDDTASIVSTTTLQLEPNTSVLSILDLDGNHRAALLTLGTSGRLVAYRRTDALGWDSGSAMSTQGHPWLKDGAAVVPNQGSY